MPSFVPRIPTDTTIIVSFFTQFHPPRPAGITYGFLGGEFKISRIKFGQSYLDASPEGKLSYPVYAVASPNIRGLNLYLGLWLGAPGLKHPRQMLSILALLRVPVGLSSPVSRLLATISYRRDFFCHCQGFWQFFFNFS